MLSFRDRASGKGCGSSGSHPSLTGTATISSSVRDRLRSLTRNIASRTIPRYNKNKAPYTPNPWYNEKSNDDLTCSAPGNAQHVEIGGRTWPAVRKSISSTAPSLGPYLDSVDSGRSPREAFDQYPSYRLKPNFKVPQIGARRWATMVTRTPPTAFRRSGSPDRHSSFSSLSEVVTRQDHEPAPQLPSLAESSGFLESLSKTGLFRNFTPLSEAKNTAGNRLFDFVPSSCITKLSRAMTLPSSG